MFKKLAVAIGCACAGGSCLAAHWYSMNEDASERSVSYFDKDTITKHAGTVTLWTKQVYNADFLQPNQAPVVVLKETYNCVKRTVQTLAFATYESDGHASLSSYKPESISDIIPGTSGEAVLELVCAKGFPLKGERKLYTPADENDAEGDAANYFRWIKWQKQKADKAASAVTGNLPN